MSHDKAPDSSFSDAATSSAAELAPQEIERKFLAKSSLPADIRSCDGWDIEQGYFDNRLKIHPSSNDPSIAILLLDAAGSGGRALGATVPIEFAQKVRQFAGEGVQAGYRLRVRVNLKTGQEEGFLTIKGPSNGASRMELETLVDAKFARDAIAEGATKKLSKTRYLVEHENESWEIDFFKGSLSGLVLAELELKHAEQVISIPPWVGREVTEDERFANSNLAKLFAKGKGLQTLALQDGESWASEANPSGNGLSSEKPIEKKKKFGA